LHVIRQATLVATFETTRLRYFLDMLMAERSPLMLVGGSGCGKSLLVSDRLAALPETHIVANVPFNYYTTAGMSEEIFTSNRKLLYDFFFRIN
jgi:dynein heavy chain